MQGLKMVLNEFIQTLNAEKGYSSHTCRAYRIDISEFIGFTVEADIPEETDAEKIFLERLTLIDKISVRNYLAFLAKTRKSKRTIARKLSSLKAFFN